MMRLREHSEIGWLMLQLLGALSLPHVTRDAQLRGRGNERLTALFHGRAGGLALSIQEMNRSRAGTDSETGSAPPQTRSPGPAPTCPSCGAALGGAYGPVCMNCDVDEVYPAPPRRRDRAERLWWLSYADDHRCAGVAIVRVTGAQTAEHAADVARALKLTPEGTWQVAAIQMPEEEEALAERYAGRLLTTAEAAAAFEAQSIGSFEEETGRVVDTEAIHVVEPG